MPPTGIRRINGAPATIAAIVVVALTYVAAVGGPMAVDPVVLGVTATAYLAGILVGPIACERPARGRVVYFAAQLALTAALLVQGPGAMALAPMALICHAVLYLERRWSVLVIGLVVAMSLGCALALPGWGARV